MEINNSLLPKDSNNLENLCKPQLTSLIDVMTILLVFLIKSFSVEGDIITQSPQVQLPVSVSKQKPEIVQSVEITKTNITSGGTVITDIKSFCNNKELMIEPLYKKLKNNLKNNKIMIQSDKDIEFNIVKRVMFTCSKAGFTDFTVLVIEKS